MAGDFFSVSISWYQWPQILIALLSVIRQLGKNYYHHKISSSVSSVCLLCWFKGCAETEREGKLRDGWEQREGERESNGGGRGGVKAVSDPNWKLTCTVSEWLSPLCSDSSIVRLPSRNCQIRSNFCQYGREIINVSVNLLGGQYERHAYTEPSLRPSHNRGTVSAPCTFFRMPS